MRISALVEFQLRYVRILSVHSNNLTVIQHRKWYLATKVFQIFRLRKSDLAKFIKFYSFSYSCLLSGMSFVF